MPHAWDSALERVLRCRLWMAQLMVIRRDSLSTLVVIHLDFSCYRKHVGLKALLPVVSNPFAQKERQARFWLREYELGAKVILLNTVAETGDCHGQTGLDLAGLDCVHTFAVAEGQCKCQCLVFIP